jgi:RNA polymerase sigma factor (TIGR02999 family)
MSRENGPGPADAWMPLVYDELRRLADRRFGEELRGRTLQPTALVHEAYLKLAEREDPPWHDRTHFLATAATAMRHILVDHARARATEKRGGGWRRITLDEGLGATQQGSEVDILSLDDAVERLAALDPRKAKVIELRFFAGLSIEETAEALGVSHMTVSSDWRFARAWIARALGDAEAP